jgi:hypothetical protein
MRAAAAGNGKWQARISVQGVNRDLGLFDTLSDAAQRWDEEVQRIRGRGSL